MTSEADFDTFAATYRQTLDRAISVSGENACYFAQSRVQWLHAVFTSRSIPCRSILDFGCGTGIGVKFLKQYFDAAEITGVDVSSKSLQIAAQQHTEPNIQFLHAQEYAPRGDRDLVFLSGVIHHIAVNERAKWMSVVAGSLRPGGMCAIWENNPWSLPARYCMKVNPFDRDAVMLSASATRRLCREAGLRVLSTHYRFVFPRILSVLRPMEKHFERLPIGAQYVVLSEVVKAFR